MRFFKSFYNSLWNFNWLKSQKNAGAWAWGYFSLLVLVVTLTVTLPAAIFLPGLVKEMRGHVEKAPSFDATLKNGQLTVTGLEQPYVRKDNDAVLVVDTSSSTSVYNENNFSVLYSTTSLLLIGRDGFLITENGKTTIQDLKSFPDFSTSKTNLLEMFDRFTKPWIIGMTILMLTVLLFIGFFISKLIAVEIAVVLALAVSSITKKGWKYSELLRVGLFAVTLPSVISLVFGAVGIQVPFIHFLALLAFLVALVVTKDEAAPQIDITDKTV